MGCSGILPLIKNLPLSYQLKTQQNAFPGSYKTATHGYIIVNCFVKSNIKISFVAEYALNGAEQIGDRSTLDRKNKALSDQDENGRRGW